jgi:hypothetical protein
LNQSKSSKPSSQNDKLAEFFKARPNVWIDGRKLAGVAGGYAWRTRVSNIRKPPYGMTIENRVRIVGGSGRENPGKDAEKFKISEYRYVPRESSKLTVIHVEAEGSPETIRKAIEAYTPLLF